MNSYSVACDACGVAMTVTDRRRLLCDECGDDVKDSGHYAIDHIPPWQVHG